MWPNPQETADLVAFTEEILHGKLHFLCNESYKDSQENICDEVKCLGNFREFNRSLKVY